jgi:hypothetical protein
LKSMSIMIFSLPPEYNDYIFSLKLDILELKIIKKMIFWNKSDFF